MTENKLIEILYPYVTCRSLAEYLSLSMAQVYNRAHTMGIKKNPIVKKSLNRSLILKAGVNSRYKKGSVPYNKGKKNPELKNTRAALTMFKKGHKPRNTREDSAKSIRLDKTGKAYEYTKISDGHWVLSHRLIWEQAHGPIESKHVVRFIDGNSMNLDLSNLECISMKENASRNSIHRFPDELKEVITLKRKLNKKISNGKKRNE
jgi:hypothetical protein